MTLPTAPAVPVDSGGTIAFGSYAGRVRHVDWAPAARRRGWRFRSWKRWHYVSIAGPEIVLAVAVVDLGWSGSAFAYLFDRTGRRLLADVSVVGLPGRAASVAPVPGGTTSTGFRSRRLYVRLVAYDAGQWRLEARSPAMTVDATLQETPAGPTLCALAPVPGGVADCTHKTPALRVVGVAGAGGAVFDLQGCTGALDHTSGLLAHDTRWRWASATDGKLALNLTEGFTAPYENALWAHGELHLLGPVRFSFDPAGNGPWRITGEQGAVDLEFHPEGQRRKRVNLVVAESSYLQPIGTFRGTVAGRAIDALVGVTEDHVARW